MMSLKRSYGKSQLRIVLWAVIIIAIPVAWVIRLNGNRPVRPDTIVLISLDTTRADHLSCYGYQVKTTPHIGAFAKIKADQIALVQHRLNTRPRKCLGFKPPDRVYFSLAA